MIFATAPALFVERTDALRARRKAFPKTETVMDFDPFLGQACSSETEKKRKQQIQSDRINACSGRNYGYWF